VAAAAAALAKGQNKDDDDSEGHKSESEEEEEEEEEEKLRQQISPNGRNEVAGRCCRPSCLHGARPTSTATAAAAADSIDQVKSRKETYVRRVDIRY
jgi:hypothetical protein